MKKYINILFTTVIIFLLGSCVDNYQDANPPRPMDGPYFTLSAAGDVIETPADGNFIAAGQTITFTLHVIDCPGGIDSVGVSIDEDGTGTAVVDQSSLSAVLGDTKGEVLVNFTTVADVSEEIDLVISITLYDGQQPIDWHGSTIDYRKSSMVPYDATLISCASTGLAGEYNSVAEGFFGDGAGGPDAAYNDLQAEITITEIRPGLYEIDDMTFGLYPQLYGDDPVPGQVNLCGTDITDRGDTDHYGDPFTITGTLNGDGTVNLSWQNTYGDRGTVVLTPK
ncbi:MAG: hypothetical protein J7L04_01060 [Bacteroidales bacterium]|nr:hypothetical protein [Bacteroidales bacterium]